MKSLNTPKQKGSNQNSILLVQIWRSIEKCIMARAYSQMAFFLEMFARYVDDDDSVHRIQLIKDSCSFDFEWFCIIYPQSFYRSPRHGVRFWGDDRKILWPELRMMATKEFVRPLNQVAIDVVAKINETKTPAMTEFLKVIEATNVINSIGEPVQPNPKVKLV
jgi:hypothetical protein